MENYQILSLLEFLGEFTRHLPPKGSHLIRYYGWYSNKGRGMRKESEAGAAHKSSPEIDAQRETPGRCNQTWAMLIKRVYEIDPMDCPKCGGQRTVVTFIEPPQCEVIEKILCHSGLCQSSATRAPPDVDGLVHELDAMETMHLGSKSASYFAASTCMVCSGNPQFRSPAQEMAVCLDWRAIRLRSVRTP